MAEGIFISFEGPDGAGKTTQIEFAAQLLAREGYEVRCTREPGGTAIGEKIRDLLLDQDNQAMDARTELLLYAASRAQHVEQVIRPALARGCAVISDRFADSTMAFQGYGRQMGRELVERVNTFATAGLTPELTFVFLLEPENALKRMKGKTLDRMEMENEGFRRRVYEGYRALKTMDPERIVELDARQDIQALRLQVEETLRVRFLQK
jgi:dTMP kinase